MEKSERMSENKIYNINQIINAHTIPMVDGSNWVKWASDRIKEGLSIRRLNKIAENLTS